jgi:hypothetical protein
LWAAWLLPPSLPLLLLLLLLLVMRMIMRMMMTAAPHRSRLSLWTLRLQSRLTVDR